MAVRAPAFSRLEADERRGQILAAARRVYVSSALGAPPPGAGARGSAPGGPAPPAGGAIAEEAGVTRGLVHHYCGTKRELYLAVVEDLAASLPDVVRIDLRERPVPEMVEAN